MANSYLEKFSLEGKVALVTGGSQGIGFDIALGLARAGATLCFNNRNAEKNAEAVKKFKDHGVEAHGYICDVTNSKSIQDMVDQINAELGPVDILVNNAGINIRVPMIDMSEEDYRKVLDIDLVGPFLCAKAVLPGMIKKGHGKIINVCSMMSELGRETVSAYASAKGGLKMLTKNICSEYGSANIQCNGIGPGYIATPLTANLRAPEEDGSKNPFDKFILSKTPAGRWGDPEDLVGPAIFLASDASNFVNGHILYVDGGMLAYLGRQQD